MPIIPPRLDDRAFDDLVAELVARIPAHTPEWTHPRVGDPGRTLIDLFAWLADAILYRANLVPERQRLRFLQLLGIPMRPAQAARGLVRVDLKDDAPSAVVLARGARVSGPLDFETLDELHVLPVTAQAYIKRSPDEDERRDLAQVIEALRELYDVEDPAPYVSTPVFVGGRPLDGGLDIVGQTVDQSLWLALLAATPEAVADVRADLGQGGYGGQPRVLSVGVVPALAPADRLDPLPAQTPAAYVWEMSVVRAPGDPPQYVTLGVLDDGTRALRRDGVVRLILPARHIGAPSNDLTAHFDAGVGKAPPRMDDPALDGRLVAWVRLRPTERVERLSLSWVGINAVEVDQRVTLHNRVVAESNGTADQLVQLPSTSVEADSLEVEVESADRGFEPWTRVDELAIYGDAPVYELDAEAGTLRFGDGVRGRIPGRRVRVARMRAGGGERGNLPAGSLGEISAVDPAGRRITRTLAVSQDLPTRGGLDAERIEDAELRIPAELRHRDRAVTEHDYRTLAAATPGVPVGRVEVLPRFKPHQRREDVPGVLSVMVLPFKALRHPPNPRPDRPMIEAVFEHLDPRRTLGTELYVIGAEYVPVGVGVGVELRDGYPRDETLQQVRDALHRYLWPLAPEGPDGGGWPLDTDVSSGELEVAVARVPGVRTVSGVSLWVEREEQWVPAAVRGRDGPQVVPMRPWQLPELLTVVAVAGEPPVDLSGAPDPFAARRPGHGVPVPVVPEVC